MPIRVFLVDDQALVRGGFRMLIEAEDDMVVVGEAADGLAAVQTLARVAADVVLMDIRMPHVDGVEATKRLAAADNPAKVLVLTTFDLDEYVFAALKAGASGFLLKDARPPELLTAIRNVAAGDAVVAPSATRRLLQQVVPTLPGRPSETADDPRLGLLTARELDVLKEIAAGASNTEIGERLYLAEGTVKTHIGRLLAKLAVRDRVGLVLFAYETGVVSR
jgi:DNA-binding NarL/FixJ family response regulator